MAASQPVGERNPIGEILDSVAATEDRMVAGHAAQNASRRQDLAEWLRADVPAGTFADEMELDDFAA